MLLSGAPVQIQLPFGNGDVAKTNPIPVPSQITITPGRASFTDGFPPLNGTPVSSGGIPPFKGDMNGLLYMLSDVDLWTSAGAGFLYNSGYQTAIGGYPKGARVLRTDGKGYWLSTTDNNMTNPNTGGAGWIALWRSVASVYASGFQTVSTAAKVLFDSIEFDPDGMWSTSGGGSFVAPWAGKYRYSGSIYLPAASAQNLAIQVYKNGSFYKQSIQFPQVSNVPLSLPFDIIVSLAVTDFLDVHVDCTSSQAGPSSGSGEPYVYAQLEYLGT